MDYEEGYISLLNAINYAIYILNHRRYTKDINEAITILEKALLENATLS